MSKEVKYLSINLDDKLMRKTYIWAQVKKWLRAWLCSAFTGRFADFRLRWHCGSTRVWYSLRSHLWMLHSGTKWTLALEGSCRNVCRGLQEYWKCFLELPTLGIVAESAALMATYPLLKPDSRNLGIGHNQIWTKTDKVDNMISMIKDLRHTFGKYWLVKQTRKV